MTSRPFTALALGFAVEPLTSTSQAVRAGTEDGSSSSLYRSTRLLPSTHARSSVGAPEWRIVLVFGKSTLSIVSTVPMSSVKVTRTFTRLPASSGPSVYVLPAASHGGAVVGLPPWPQDPSACACVYPYPASCRMTVSVPSPSMRIHRKRKSGSLSPLRSSMSSVYTVSVRPVSATPMSSGSPVAGSLPSIVPSFGQASLVSVSVVPRRSVKVTRTFSRLPTSASANLYVRPVAPEMGFSLVPSTRSHR